MLFENPLGATAYAIAIDGIKVDCFEQLAPGISVLDFFIETR